MRTRTNKTKKLLINVDKKLFDDLKKKELELSLPQTTYARMILKKALDEDK